MENPFNDPVDEPDLETQRVMLQDYDENLSVRGSTCRSVDILLERQFVANDEKVQKLSEFEAGAATINTIATVDSSDDRRLPTTKELLGLVPAEAPETTSGLCERPQSSQGWSMSSNNVHFEAAAETQSKLQADQSSIERYSINSVALDLDEVGSEYSGYCVRQLEQSSPIEDHSDRRWHTNPTHEDIRQRFKRYESRSSSQSAETDTASDSHCDSFVKGWYNSVMAPSETSLTDLDKMKFFRKRAESAIEKERAENLPTGHKHGQPEVERVCSDSDPLVPANEASGSFYNLIHPLEPTVDGRSCTES